jgi:hypothetical protein
MAAGAAGGGVAGGGGELVTETWTRSCWPGVQPGGTTVKKVPRGVLNGNRWPGETPAGMGTRNTRIFDAAGVGVAAGGTAAGGVAAGGMVGGALPGGTYRLLVACGQWIQCACDTFFAPRKSFL